MAEFSKILMMIALAGSFLLGYAARAAVSAHRRRKAYRWRVIYDGKQAKGG